jgi:NAD(P)-dependent dehydrogenase (short-subunit alcohol dehydrogenase family)
MSGTAVVFGARNLGGAIIEHLLQQGWNVAGVARSDETVARVAERGGLGIAADASDASEVRATLERVAGELGAPTLLVNAVTAARPTREGPFGGGPLAEAEVEDFRGWTAAVAEQAFVFLSESARALRATGAGGTIIQVTGGSSRRAMPGRGLWSAGAQATRALVHAAAQELREDEIHAALLIVDATIASPKTESFTRDQPENALADQRLIAEAVGYLAGQQPRAWTHELTLTPAGDRWVP